MGQCKIGLHNIFFLSLTPVFSLALLIVLQSVILNLGTQFSSTVLHKNTLSFIRPMEQAISPREPREMSRSSMGDSGQGLV